MVGHYETGHLELKDNEAFWLFGTVIGGSPVLIYVSPVGPSSCSKFFSTPVSAPAKEAKYAPENWIDEGHPTLEFPVIQDK
ncbi:hypothetical protein HAX54_041829, partial [Datura stramonium]|nr:hypothetical protein [Datura stramonium]